MVVGCSVLHFFLSFFRLLSLLPSSAVFVVFIVVDIFLDGDVSCFVIVVLMVFVVCYYFRCYYCFLVFIWLLTCYFSL